MLPLAVLACALVWQVVLAGHAAWAVGSAARSAARAHAVGLDSRAAARAALPRSLERRLQVTDRGGGRVEVRVAVPAILGVPALGSVGATAHFEPQSG